MLGQRAQDFATRISGDVGSRLDESVAAEGCEHFVEGLGAHASLPFRIGNLLELANLLGDAFALVRSQGGSGLNAGGLAGRWDELGASSAPCLSVRGG